MARHSKFGKQLLASMRQMADALESGNKGVLTIRTVAPLGDPARYSAADVKASRLRLNVSQAVFASVLGISVMLCQAWEQGLRKPSKMACRLLDEINADPDRWRKKLLAA